MRCPHCGDKRTAVLRTVYRGHSAYRQRQCLNCKMRFGTQERQVRWDKLNRKWPGRSPSRRQWRKLRILGVQSNCENEACGKDFSQAGLRRHVDHIVPARLIRRLKLGNPDLRENLQSLCGICHGCKLQADHKLCLADKLGYLEILRRLGFNMERVDRALVLYGL